MNNKNNEFKKVIIYTDGACKGNPGLGGWGAILQYGDKTKELYGGESATTNNRMELLAAIKALSSLKKRCDVVLYTDSKYVQQGVSVWLDNWIAKNWRTAGNKPVKNKDLWEQLATLRDQHDVDWRWVKGHSGHPLNDHADMLANKGVEAYAASNNS